MIPFVAVVFAAVATAAPKPTPESHPHAFRGREDPLVARLQDASCKAMNEFARLLGNKQSHGLRIEKNPLCFDDGGFREQGYWRAASEFGCARVVTSDDSRLRIWTTALEIEATRGSAFATWRGADGEVQVYQDQGEDDLHLDAIIDGVYRLDGKRPLYLIVGLRAYVTKYPGGLPRRFAMVVELSRSGKLRQVQNAFSVAGKRRSTLLLRAPEPDTGKFRHHLFAAYWLRFYRGDATLVLEPIPTSRRWGVRKSPDRVATWNGGSFRVRPGWTKENITATWR